MLKKFTLAIVALSCGLAAGVIAPMAQQKSAGIDPSVVDKYVSDTFKSASPEWQARIKQDEAQVLCSQYRNAPPAAEFKKIQESQTAALVYPADGNVLGDWKNGQKLAQRGTGGQFSDKPDGPIGGNCYACHQLSRAELSFGTMGPTLLEYGRIRKFKAEDAKAAYAKIYNAQAVQPCSNMPRFGHNKFLSEQDMKDLTAYLFDPDSPVNK
jgi:L-cysteine S-thiosulfotransferase